MTQTCASFCVCVSPSLRTQEINYLLSVGKTQVNTRWPTSVDLLTVSVDLLSVTYLRCPLTYFPFSVTGKPPVDLLTVTYFRWPTSGDRLPVTYSPTYGVRWPTFRFRWPVNHPLTYLRWPTSADLLSVTTCQGDHGHYFLAMTSLWPWSHTSRIPRSHTASLSSPTQPFLIFFFTKILVHGSSKGLFCDPFRVCLFCFNFFWFFSKLINFLNNFNIFT